MDSVECSPLTLRLLLLCLRRRSDFSPRTFSTAFWATIRSRLRLLLRRREGVLSLLATAVAAIPVAAPATSASPLVKLRLRFRSGDRILPSRKLSAGIEDISEVFCCTYLELLSAVGIRGLPCRLGMISTSTGPPPLDVTLDSSVAER